MSRFWSPLLHDLSPYVPGEQPQDKLLIKLNTNENPYPPAPAVAEALQQALTEQAQQLRLYPDPESNALAAALAAYHGVEPSQIFVGNGSDEVLAFVFMALLQHQEPVLFPDITYSFYPVYCRLFAIAHRCLPLDEQLQIQLADYRHTPAGGIIFPNPNAPTARLLPLTAIADLCAARPDIPVVVDEAYIDFADDTDDDTDDNSQCTPASALRLLGQFRNLLIVRTFSKSRALAGMRVGYAIGDAELIDGLKRVKNSFNSYPLDRLAQAAAMASLSDENYFQQRRRQVIDDRENLSRALSELGFEVLPSAANFIFVRHPRHAGKALAEALRAKHIIVRRFDAPRIGDYLRISIGSADHCRALLDELKNIVSPPASC